MNKYFVVQYPDQGEQGVTVEENLNYLDAKKLADETPKGSEREVYIMIDGERATVYRGTYGGL